MTTVDGDLTVYLPRDLQVPLTDLAVYALGRHRRMAREMLEDAGRAENDLLDRALCQRVDDIDLALVRRTPATQEEREIVLDALARIKGCSMLAAAAVAQMEDDLRAA